MQLLATGLLGYIIPLLCLLGLCHAIEPTTDCPSDGDPCLQGVTDPYWGPAFTDRTANAKADCSRFQEDTLYGHTATVTGIPQPYPTAGPGSKSMPVYVIEQCRLNADYASACSCYGFPAQTLWLPDATLTLTVRPTITTTTALETYYPEDTITATTETTSTESYSPNYTPSTPFSYTPCAFDPLNGGLFDLLGPNGQIVVKSRYDPNGKAVEFRAGVSEGDGNSDSENFPGYRFYSPPNATTNVFDIIIPAGPATGTGTGKEKTKYLAVFSSGAVGFVDRSSNGQTYVPSPSSSTDGGSDGEGGQYVTTIWSVQCNGFATAGILGGIRFDFGIRDNGELTVGSYRAGRRGRSQRKDRRQSPLQSVPGGFWIIPKAGVVPPVGDIPSGEGEGGACMEPEEKVKKVESASSQCGSEDWREYFVPKFDFEDECRFLHKCWATCTQTMTSCNEAFLSLLLGTCDSSIPSTSSSPSNSPSSPSTLSSPSPSNGGLTDTTNLTACHNLAHFTHYYLSSTPHAFAVYASVYSQVCVVTDDSVVSSTSSTSSTTSNTCTLYDPDTPPTSGSGDSNNNNTSTTDNPNYYCSGTVSHPYMTSCPIGTSASPTKKGSTCVDLASDPEHCGHCNYQCPAGSKCVNGACSSVSCKGRGVSTCGDWSTNVGASCGTGWEKEEGNCMCVAAVRSMSIDSMSGGDGAEDGDGDGDGDGDWDGNEEEEGFCVDSGMPCKLLKGCERNGQCVLGSVCVKGCCSGKGVCVETDWRVNAGGDGGKRVFGTVVGGDTLGRKFDGW